ncbi:DUF72 domain-containing protein [Celerinatantimonas sp. YJH-8]|uniref:DUF72 domain-containing protein n=1 Tax=Celerinatantimonas sp. YJH-8 TaxID=3228714 RepID=UPI0038CBD61E
MSDLTHLYIGLPMWSHDSWQTGIYGDGCPTSERLRRYGKIFNTVEGNTTFYAIPSPAIVRRWANTVPDSFKYTFKLPQTITHRDKLRHCAAELTSFLNVMEPLFAATGQWMIQLPPSFSAESLPVLETFLNQIPQALTVAVEVRHPMFYSKGGEELRLNQMLHQYHANRVMFDSRALFSTIPASAVVADAQQKKPKLPVHVVATAQQPLIRFIGTADLQANQRFFHPWLIQLTTWIEQGITPYVMVHTPDNALAPQLAIMIYQWLNSYWLGSHDFSLRPQPSLLPILEDPQLGFF